MADLDDFFAKKDKKKGKGTKKGFSKANTEVLAKNLEENERKEQVAEDKANDASRSLRIIEQNQTSTGGGGGIAANETEADEWKEYEDKKLDYTNLKIDTLKLEQEGESNEEDDEVNGDGEKVRKNKDGRPWSKLVASDSLDKPGSENVESPAAAEPVKKDKPVTPAEAPAVRSSYVPPHLRNASGASSSSANMQPTRGGPRMRPKHAPDLNSEVYFPSLSGSGTDDPTRGQLQSSSGHGRFEEVRSGGGQNYNSKATEAPRMTLGNKYSALGE